MKEQWLKRYRNSTNMVDESHDVLVAFNANIDVVFDVGQLEIDLDVEPEKLEEISGLKELKAALSYCIENGENREMELNELEHEFDSGEEYIGGQAGIMANYLSGTGNGVIFYTPFLSEELAANINEKVLYPMVDGDFVLKNVRDSANTDRTKRNLIFEFSSETTGRAIFSRKQKGFGPYFRKGVEENFEEIEQNVDRIILSGFHDADGNIEAKLRKSEDQIKKLESNVHLEYVHRNDNLATMVAEHIMPGVDSIGLDEDELRRLSDVLEIETEIDENPSLGEVFHAGKQIVDRFDMQRCHIHTYRFHLTVAKKEYNVSKERIRDAMLFGEVSAIQKCHSGEMPTKEDIKDFDMDEKRIQDLDDFQHFQDYFDLENFIEEGVAELEDHKLAAIPTIIDEEPERLVGMGDVISAGAFTAEID